jgi:hypothetical protein
MPFTDAYGIWDDLCLVLPVTTQEQLLSKDTSNRNLFRFRFDTDWPRWHNENVGYKSYLQCKLFYRDDGGGFSYLQQQFKVYVKQEPQLIEKKPLLEFNDNPWTSRRLSVKRTFWHRLNWEGHSLDKPFQVSIDTFIDN